MSDSPGTKLAAVALSEAPPGADPTASNPQPKTWISDHETIVIESDSITRLSGLVADNIAEGSSRKWAGQSGADVTRNHVTTALAPRPIPRCASLASAALLLEDCATGVQVLNPQWSGDAETLALITAALAATNPTTGNTFEQDVLLRAQALKDANGNALVPSGAIQEVSGS